MSNVGWYKFYFSYLMSWWFTLNHLLNLLADRLKTKTNKTPEKSLLVTHLTMKTRACRGFQGVWFLFFLSFSLKKKIYKNEQTNTFRNQVLPSFGFSILGLIRNDEKSWMEGLLLRASGRIQIRERSYIILKLILWFQVVQQKLWTLACFLSWIPRPLMKFSVY